MSNHTSDEIQPITQPPGRMLSPSKTSASGSTTSTSTSTSIPSTLKKSKRQAERMVRAAFAATQRKEQEEDRFRSRSHTHTHTQLQSQSQSQPQPQPQSPPRKKPKARRRSKLDIEHRDGNCNSNSNNNTINNANANAKIDEGEASRKFSQVVTPSPTHSKSQAILPSTTISKSHTKKKQKQKQKRSKAQSQSPSQSQSQSQSQSCGEPGGFEGNTNDKISSSSSSSSSTPGHSQTHRDSHSHDHPPHQTTHNRKRKRRKIVYKAISGPQRPIYGHALDLVALVCNNAYCATKSSGASTSTSISSTNDRPKSKSKSAHESAAAAIATPMSVSTESPQLSPQHISNSTSNATTPSLTPKPPHAPGSNSKSKSKYNDRTFHPQPHRILDRPRGYTHESEPLRERLLRLQLRQRFASATSMGMSPIEFARKLLKLWGGTLEQVYDETKASSVSVSMPIPKPKPKGTGVATATASASARATDNDDENASMLKETIMTRIASSEKSNNYSSLTLGKPNTETESKPASRSRFEEELAFATMSKAAFESYGFDNSIGDLEPRSIHPDAQPGNSNLHGSGNGLLPGNIHAVANANANGIMMYDLNQPRNFNNNNNSANHLQHNTFPTKFDANNNGLGKRKPIDRIERTKKLKQRRHRKKLKEAEAIAVVSSSVVIDDSKSPVATTRDGVRDSIIVGVDAPVGNTDQNDAMALTSATPSSSSSSKRKSVKRSPRQLIEDSSLPVLYKDMRLSQPDDDKYLNALHCFVREQLLEVYVLQKNTGSSSSSRAASASGGLHEENNNNTTTEEAHNIVGIRCAWCGSLPKAERGKGQSMSTFFPKSIGEIYRGVCTWQRIHFPVCEHMPESCRNEYKIHKERDLTRGKKAYWIQSACAMGFRNIDSERNGLTYQPGSPFDQTEYFRGETDPGDGRVRAKKPRERSRNRKRLNSNEAARGNDNDDDNDHDHSGTILSAFAGDEDHEFELFGTDFDQSLEESAEVRVSVTHDGETITATAF